MGVRGTDPWAYLKCGLGISWPLRLGSQSFLLPSRMNNGILSPTDIQSHIYTAFLQRKTADVALRVSGTWRAVYKLHRIVLIQSVSPPIATSFSFDKASLTWFLGVFPISLHYRLPRGLAEQSKVEIWM